MKTGRGKWIVITTVVLGFALLGLAKDRIVGEYYVWKLKSGDMRERQAAEARLRDRGLKALPVLLKAIADDFAPNSSRVWCGNCREMSSWYLAAKALKGMWNEAIPALRGALQDDDPVIRRAAAVAPDEIQRE